MRLEGTAMLHVLIHSSFIFISSFINYECQMQWYHLSLDACHLLCFRVCFFVSWFLIFTLLLICFSSVNRERLTWEAVISWGLIPQKQNANTMSTSDCVRLWKIAGMNWSTTQNSACEEDASKKSVRPNAEWGKLCPSFPVRWRLRNGNNVERFHEILNLARGIIENNRLWHLTFKDEMDGWSTRCSPETWRKKCWSRKKSSMEKLTSPNCKLLNTEEAKTHVTDWKGLMGDTRVPWKKTKSGERWKSFRSSNAKRLLETGKGL